MKISMLNKIILISLLFSSLAKAGPFDFVKEGEIKAALDKNDFHTALLKWPAAQSDTPTNQALFAFVMYKDNLKTLGFDRLSVIGDLNAVSPQVKKLWQTELGLNSPFWRNEKVVWNKKLAQIFLNQTANVIAAWSMHDLTSKQIKTATFLLNRIKGTDAASWLKWQLALAYGVQGKTKDAVSYLQSLLNSDQNVIGRDEVLMAAARMLYQDNKLDLAMKYYDKVQKSSDYWLESLEEKGWIYARLNNFDRTLGEMKSVLVPAFASQVGPEPYFLTTLADLRVCDYYDIFKVLHAFRAHNRDRVSQIEKLAATGHTVESDRALTKMENGVQSWAELGADTSKLPRFLNRDEILDRAISQRRDADLQDEEITSLSQTNSFYSVYKSYAESMKRQAQPPATERMKVLAQSDVSEMKKNLIKLQLVETEAIHRMTVGQNHTRSIKTKDDNGDDDQIEFPYEENEVWLDEVGHYQTSTKGCPVVGKESSKTL